MSYRDVRTNIEIATTPIASATKHGEVAGFAQYIRLTSLSSSPTPR